MEMELGYAMGALGRFLTYKVLRNPQGNTESDSNKAIRYAIQKIMLHPIYENDTPESFKSVMERLNDMVRSWGDSGGTSDEEIEELRVLRNEYNRVVSIDEKSKTE